MKNKELIDIAKSLVGEVLIENKNGNSAGGVGAALLTIKGNIYTNFSKE